MMRHQTEFALCSFEVLPFYLVTRPADSSLSHQRIYNRRITVCLTPCKVVTCSEFIIHIRAQLYIAHIGLSRKSVVQLRICALGKEFIYAEFIYIHCNFLFSAWHRCELHALGLLMRNLAVLVLKCKLYVRAVVFGHLVLQLHFPAFSLLF